MRRALFIVVACFGALLAAAPSQAATRGQCNLPDAQPLWIDYADGTVPFWSSVFARPGIVAAASNFLVPPQLRAHGARTVYFDLSWKNRVGAPSAPVPAAKIVPSADKLFDTAAQSSGCDKPLIALNELFGASLPTPWSDTNTAYRADVLAYVRELASRGARPFLLVSSEPFTDAEAADWWRQVAQSSDIVLEVYFSGAKLWKQGAVLGNRRLRTTMRQRVEALLAIGVPASRIGIMLQLGSTPGAGGREGLQPASAWFDVVKWEALAARQVAQELKLATIWSWGWGTFNVAGNDPDKQTAACVWLWTRDHALCDGPAAAGAGWDASLAEGQDTLPAGTVCTLGSASVQATAVAALTRVTGDRDVALTALVKRLAEAEQVTVSPNDVLVAEREAITYHFGGSRAAYVQALARAHASVAVARGVLADELRAATVSAQLRVPAPTEQAIEDYYATYAAERARPVRVRPAPRWLGGRSSGLALDTLAPPGLFDLPTGKTRTVETPGGVFEVTLLGDPEPLGELALATARPAIRAALVALERVDAFVAWTQARQDAALARITCTHDQLPQVAAIDLLDYLPFLAVPL